MIKVPTPTLEEAILSLRSTCEVFKDHLRLRMVGQLEQDLQRNYADDVVLLTENSVLRGHNGMRTSAARLAEQLPSARFEFTACQVEEAFAFLVWQAESDNCRVECGADTFMIKNGKICMHSIHYHLLDN